ncbi:ankyrin [Aspergillus varians]
MCDNRIYTIGWICALRTEYVAATVFLDKQHEKPYVPPNDNNAYTVGEIGEHNVVIAVLPIGEYGTASAASVAKDMVNAFPNVRIGLMVGIGGGVPTTHDVRLGDVVVSAPRDGQGGVFQYDFGKTIQDQEFQATGFLNQPPTALRTAVNALATQYEIHGHELESAISDILAKFPRLRRSFSRPDPGCDRLFKSEVTHEAACTTRCGGDESTMKWRPERTDDEDDPAIHYGLIASGNQLMKDAIIRDKLAEEKDVLCFEMEAAGLMNHFPCLVIRGICDYSDSHKNKEWQGFAAMVAAAYVKDLLRQIHPKKVEDLAIISDALSGLHKVSEEHRDITKQLLQTGKDFANERTSTKEHEIHQLFRLTDGGKDATYEWYKDRVEERVEGTCMWFLHHEHFQKWLSQESGPLLVTADPGCGKSVLAKYLTDHVLPQSATVCYFFFKDQDQNSVRQALCALIHQLFSQKPSLIKHAKPQYEKDGKGLINSTKSLWEVLENAVGDVSVGPIILALDALDECAESEIHDLIRTVNEQSMDNRIGRGKLKYFLTCRPYEQIISRFHKLLGTFPNVRIPGEEESETISQEVNIVITHRLNQLSLQKKFSSNTKGYLQKRLKECTHRTYLWAYLVFEFLENESFKKTPSAIQAILAAIPDSVNQAYEQILSRSKNDPMVRKTLSIILAASRPLTLSEMNVALNIGSSVKCFDDLDLEDEEDFKSRLRTWCGLFISIYHGKIYFLHQTAREFLAADVASTGGKIDRDMKALRNSPGELHWQHCITSQQAHFALAELCVLYLKIFNSDNSPSGGLLPASSSDNDPHSVFSTTLESHVFLDYSAKSWGFHFREANIDNDAKMIQTALEICDPSSKSYSTWFNVFWNSVGGTSDNNFTSLMIASYHGHHAVVKSLLHTGADLDTMDAKVNRTALSWAVDQGREAVVKLLLSEHGVGPGFRSAWMRTPLLLAAKQGRESICKLLLSVCDVGPSPGDIYLEEALELAVGNRRVSIVKLLLERDDLDLNYGYSDRKGRSSIVGTPLYLAVNNRQERIVQFLLARHDIDLADIKGTPLFLATAMEYKRIFQLLLEKGGDSINMEGTAGGYEGTPLFVAAAEGFKMMVKRLLAERGVDLNRKGYERIQKDNWQGTPLSVALRRGHMTVARLILAEDNVDANGRYINPEETVSIPALVEVPFQGTPLFLASTEGYGDIVRWLLTKDNIDPNSKGCIGGLADRGQHYYGFQGSPLSFAAWSGQTKIVKLLIAKDSVDLNSRAYAAHRYPNGALKFSLFGDTSNDTNIPVDYFNLFGDTSDTDHTDDTNDTNDCDEYYHASPLCLSIMEQHTDISTLLLATRGVEIDAKDGYGRTPLWWATLRCNWTLDNFGFTPLLYASRRHDRGMIRLLLNHGADLEAKENFGFTPLLYASRHHDKDMIRLLLEYGANTKAKDYSGSTPLLYASRENINAKDNLGCVPLLKIVRRLRGRMLELHDARTLGVRTPMVEQAVKNLKEAVQLSLKHGADVEAKDNDGYSPLSFAIGEDNEEILKLLTADKSEIDIEHVKSMDKVSPLKNN